MADVIEPAPTRSITPTPLQLEQEAFAGGLEPEELDETLIKKAPDFRTKTTPTKEPSKIELEREAFAADLPVEELHKEPTKPLESFVSTPKELIEVNRKWSNNLRGSNFIGSTQQYNQYVKEISSVPQATIDIMGAIDEGYTREQIASRFGIEPSIVAQNIEGYYSQVVEAAKPRARIIVERGKVMAPYKVEGGYDLAAAIEGGITVEKLKELEFSPIDIVDAQQYHTKKVLAAGALEKLNRYREGERYRIDEYLRDNPLTGEAVLLLAGFSQEQVNTAKGIPGSKPLQRSELLSSLYSGYYAAQDHLDKIASSDYIPTIEEWKALNPTMTAGGLVNSYKERFGNYKQASAYKSYPGGNSRFVYDNVPTILASKIEKYTPELSRDEFYRQYYTDKGWAIQPAQWVGVIPKVEQERTAEAQAAWNLYSGSPTIGHDTFVEQYLASLLGAGMKPTDDLRAIASSKYYQIYGNKPALSTQSISMLSRAGLPAARATLPEYTAKDITPLEWVVTGANVAAITSRLWLPTALKGLQAVLTKMKLIKPNTIYQQIVSLSDDVIRAGDDLQYAKESFVRAAPNTPEEILAYNQVQQAQASFDTLAKQLEGLTTKAHLTPKSPVAVMDALQNVTDTYGVIYGGAGKLERAIESLYQTFSYNPDAIVSYLSLTREYQDIPSEVLISTIKEMAKGEKWNPYARVPVKSPVATITRGSPTTSVSSVATMTPEQLQRLSGITAPVPSITRAVFPITIPLPKLVPTAVPEFEPVPAETFEPGVVPEESPLATPLQAISPAELASPFVGISPGVAPASAPIPAPLTAPVSAPALEPAPITPSPVTTAEATIVRPEAIPVPFIPFDNGGEIENPDDIVIPGTIVWKQGLFWIIIPPPYTKKFYSKRRPIGARGSATGKGSAKRTLQVIGGKVGRDIKVNVGWAIVHIKAMGVPEISFGKGKTKKLTTKKKSSGRGFLPSGFTIGGTR